MGEVWFARVTSFCAEVNNRVCQIRWRIRVGLSLMRKAQAFDRCCRSGGRNSTGDWGNAVGLDFGSTFSSI